MKIVNAKCPNCGANLDIPKETERVKCEYCNQNLLIDDEKIKIEGNIRVAGIETDDELLTSANELLSMNEYLKAKKKFLEFSEKNPDNYQGWLGLLICRTRNFTIKDNNIMFGIDVNKYYEHFLRTASDEIKNKYVETIENYLHPSIEKDIEKTVNKIKKDKNNYKGYLKYTPATFLIIGGLAFFTNSAVFGGILWIIAGLILIPKIRDILKITKKKATILSIVFGISGFIIFAIESPIGIEGNWIAMDKSIEIEFEKSRNVKITLPDGNIIVGRYESKYFNGDYIITITTSNSQYNNYVVKYNSSEPINKKLCTYKENKCVSYFKDKD